MRLSFRIASSCDFELAREIGEAQALRAFPGLPAKAIVKIAIENLKRQALHAASLGFKHPITKEFMLFESPIPNDMAELITSLEKLNKQ